MRAENVALIPSCAECGTRWLPVDEERWRPYLGGDVLPARSKVNLIVSRGRKR